MGLGGSRRDRCLQPRRGSKGGSRPTKAINSPTTCAKWRSYESPGHQRNFLDCVKSRKPTITPVETAHHSAIPGHLGLISMLTRKKLQWDVANENILNDNAASELLSRPYRAPWQLA